MAFEKGHHVIDPEEQALQQQIEEIQEHVAEIKKETCSSDKLNDVQFKNSKIVAWLLNRNKEMQSTERQSFFKNINIELQKSQEREVYRKENSYIVEQDYDKSPMYNLNP